LQGPMRFGAGVVMERQHQQQQQRSSLSPQRRKFPLSTETHTPPRTHTEPPRRRSSLSASAHQLVCGLRLAPGDLGSIALLLVLYTLQGLCVCVCMYVCMCVCDFAV
jgi:hypothetical protein